MRRAIWAVILGTMAGGAMGADGPCGVALAVRRSIDSGPLAVLDTLPELGPNASNAWGMVRISAVTEVDGHPTLASWQRGHDSWYFYPASTVKLFAALAAYEKINDLAVAGLDETTPLRVFSLDPELEPREQDGKGMPVTVHHESHKVFVVSDNDAFNTLYDFVGPGELNDRMAAWGVRRSWVSQRLAIARTPGENRRAPKIEIGLETVLATVNAREIDESPGPRTLAGQSELPTVFLNAGRGYMKGGKLIDEAFSFAGKNFASLEDLQLALCLLVRPEVRHAVRCEGVDGPGGLGSGPRRDRVYRSGPGSSDLQLNEWNKLAVLPGRPLDLTDAQREQLIASATMYPRESESPKYDPAEFPDDHVKFLLPGLLRVRPLEEWRVVNKIGLAYGFVTENAYVEHRPTGHAVFVAAVIHRNPNGIYNDNEYDYATSLAEMATLGEVVGRALVGDGE